MKNKKWIYGLKRNINGILFYRKYTTEEEGYSDIEKLGAAVISKKKSHSNDIQTIFICYK